MRRDLLANQQFGAATLSVADNRWTWHLGAGVAGSNPVAPTNFLKNPHKLFVGMQIKAVAGNQPQKWSHGRMRRFTAILSARTWGGTSVPPRSNRRWLWTSILVGVTTHATAMTADAS
jgi:hypothetical protein